MVEVLDDGGRLKKMKTEEDNGLCFFKIKYSDGF